MWSSIKIKTNRKNDMTLILQTGSTMLLYQDMNYKSIFSSDNSVQGVISYQVIDKRDDISLYLDGYLDTLDQNDIAYNTEQKK